MLAQCTALQPLGSPGALSAMAYWAFLRNTLLLSQGWFFPLLFSNHVTIICIWTLFFLQKTNLTCDKSHQICLNVLFKLVSPIGRHTRWSGFSSAAFWKCSWVTPPAAERTGQHGLCRGDSVSHEWVLHKKPSGSWVLLMDVSVMCIR